MKYFTTVNIQKSIKMLIVFNSMQLMLQWWLPEKLSMFTATQLFKNKGSIPFRPFLYTVIIMITTHCRIWHTSTNMFSQILLILISRNWFVTRRILLFIVTNNAVIVTQTNRMRLRMDHALGDTHKNVSQKHIPCMRLKFSIN